MTTSIEQRDLVAEIIAGFPKRFAGLYDDGSEWAWRDAQEKADKLLDLFGMGLRHCSTCECIHEECGAVVGSAACFDFHQRQET